MNEDQISRAMDAIYDCIASLSTVAHEILDRRDGRLEQLRENIVKLQGALYSKGPEPENDEHPSR